MGDLSRKCFGQSVNRDLFRKYCGQFQTVMSGHDFVGT